MVRTLLKPLSFVPALLLMYMIYSFSAQPGEVSSQLSYKVSYKIVETVDQTLDADMADWEIDTWVYRIHGLVRKLAHMAEYFALAVAVSFPLYVYGVRGIWLMLLAGFICVGFACGDEYHQSFVEGRGPSVRDVAIDSFGVFWGIILVRIVGWTGRKTIFRPRKKRSKHSETQNVQTSHLQQEPRVQAYRPQPEPYAQAYQPQQEPHMQPYQTQPELRRQPYQPQPELYAQASRLQQEPHMQPSQPQQEEPYAQAFQPQPQLEPNVQPYQTQSELCRQPYRSRQRQEPRMQAFQPQPQQEPHVQTFQPQQEPHAQAFQPQTEQDVPINVPYRPYAQSYSYDDVPPVQNEK